MDDEEEENNPLDNSKSTKSHVFDLEEQQRLRRLNLEKKLKNKSLLHFAGLGESDDEDGRAGRSSNGNNSSGSTAVYATKEEEEEAKKKQKEEEEAAKNSIDKVFSHRKNKLKKLQFENEAERIRYCGYNQGLYVRMRLEHVPPNLIRNLVLKAYLPFVLCYDAYPNTNPVLPPLLTNTNVDSYGREPSNPMHREEEGGGGGGWNESLVSSTVRQFVDTYKQYFKRQQVGGSSSSAFSSSLMSSSMHEGAEGGDEDTNTANLHKILTQYTNFGFIRARIKRHRWQRKIFKSYDPLIISIGWKKYQVVPIFCMHDEQIDRNRYLKYCPEHMHFDMIFFGPKVNPNEKMLCIQNINSNDFRVSMTGAVKEIQYAPIKVVKKLKLVGYPHTISSKTAFIRDMFNSEYEVNRFIGAKIRTVSGVRGIIKKPEKLPSSALQSSSHTNGHHHHHHHHRGHHHHHGHKRHTKNKMDAKQASSFPGLFRATFEDKILKSDIVFLRSWIICKYVVFFSFVQNLLHLPPPSTWQDRSMQDKHTQLQAITNFTQAWDGHIRTISQLRRDFQMAIPHQPDSEYKDIRRRDKRFNPLHVSKRLEESLPYKTKPKNMHKGDQKPMLLKSSVRFEDKEEKKKRSTLGMLQAVKKSRVATRKQYNSERRKKRRKEIRKEARKFQARNKFDKKRRMAIEQSKKGKR